MRNSYTYCDALSIIKTQIVHLASKIDTKPGLESSSIHSPFLFTFSHFCYFSRFPAVFRAFVKKVSFVLFSITCVLIQYLIHAKNLLFQHMAKGIIPSPEQPVCFQLLCSIAFLFFRYLYMCVVLRTPQKRPYIHKSVYF